MTHLANVSSVVTTTSFPTLSQIGKSFASTIPDPDVFFKKAPQHCGLFRQEFPEVYLVPEKTGYLKATWQFATYFFSNLFSHQLEPIKSRSEVFASLFEKGKQGLSQINDDLNHLENLLSIPNVLSQAEIQKILGEIKAIREERVPLQECPPKETQALDAAKRWTEQIEIQANAAGSLLQRFANAKGEWIASSLTDPSSSALRAMTDSFFPIQETFVASVLSDELGKNTKIETPTGSEFLHTLISLVEKSIGKTPSPQDLEMLQELEDAALFDSFFKSFQTKMLRYPLERFVRSKKEFKDVLEEGIGDFRKEISSRLDTLDQNQRPAFLIPVATLEDFFSKLKELDFENLSLKNSGAHHLFRIAKRSDGLYDLQVFLSRPLDQQKVKEGLFQPFIQYEGLSRGDLTEDRFLRAILTRSTVAKSLDALQEKFAYSWTTPLVYISTRFLEFAKSLLSTTQLPIPGIGSYAGGDVPLLEACYQKAAAVPSLGEERCIPGKRVQNPWGIWEAYFSGTDRRGSILDVKLGSLLQFGRGASHPQSEKALNLLKVGRERLSKQVGEDLFISPGKLQFATALLEEIGQHEDDGKRKIQEDVFENRPPLVATREIYPTWNQDAIFPKVAPPVESGAPVETPKYQQIDSPAGWNPATDGIQPVLSLVPTLEAAYQAGNYDGIISSIKSFYRRFNMDSLGDSFWNHLDPSELDGLFETLEKISTLYFKSSFDASGPRLPDAESGLLMMENLALADKLLSLMNGGNRDLSLPLRDLFPYLFNRSAFFRFGDPALDRRLLAVRRYCESDFEYRSPFSTDMSAVRQPVLEKLLGDTFNIPSLLFVSSGRNHGTSTNIHELGPGTSSLEGYYHAHEEWKNAPGWSTAEQMARAYVEPNVFPPNFYRARQIAFNAGYFFRGTFVKPSHFVRDSRSYDVEYHAFNLIREEVSMFYYPFVKMQFGMSGQDMELWMVQPTIRGIDASVFAENPEVADGLHRAHQFSHLQREAEDPVIQPMLDRHLKEHLGYDYYLSGHGFAPGIKEAGRNLYDLHIAMIADELSLKNYLTKQEFEQISSFRGEPGVQIANTLSFFRSKTQLLKNPDMQLYFLNLIFEPPLLYQELMLPNRGPELERQLAEFIGPELAVLSQLGDAKMALFYLELGARLNQYSLFMRRSFPKVYRGIARPALFEEIPRMLRDASENPLYSDEKGVLHGSLALEYGAKEELDADEVKDFLQNVILYHRFPPSGKTINIQLREDLKRLLTRFAPSIERVLKDAPQQWIHEVLKKAKSDIPTDAEFLPSPDNGLVYLLKDGSAIADFQRGVLIAAGLDAIPLPAKALHSPAYRAVYGTREFTGKSITPNIYEFTDSEGRRNRMIRLKSGTYVLQRQFPRENGRWYQFLPQEFVLEQVRGSENIDREKTIKELVGQIKEAVASIPGAEGKVDETVAYLRKVFKSDKKLLPLSLIDGYSHWFNSEAPGEVLIADASGYLRYKAEILGSTIMEGIETSKQLSRVYRLDSQGRKKELLADIYRGDSTFAWITQFEDSQHVCVWKDPETQQPNAIEFTRFGREGLTFQRKKELFESDQFPGYTLKQIQTSPLGSNGPGFLRLENKRGGEKLILAYQVMVLAKESSLSTALSFDRKRNQLGVNHHYFVYDKTNGDRVFSSKEIAPSFFMAAILGAKKQFREAMDLMRQFGQGSNPFLPEERAILDTIGMTDDSPQTAALMALSYCLKEKNSLDHPSPKASKNSNPFAMLSQNLQDTIAMRYFMEARDLGAYRLTLDEERFLLYHGIFKEEREAERTLIDAAVKNDPEKARILIGALGRGETPDLNTFFPGPKAPVAKGAPAEPMPLPPIVENPLEFFEEVPASTLEGAKEGLKAMLEGQGASSIEKKSFGFYLKDSLYYHDHRDNTAYRIKGLDGFVKKLRELEQSDRYIEEILAQGELSILRLAGKWPESGPEQARMSAKLQGNALVAPDLNHLILLYMSEDLASLSELNPELKEADISALDSWIDRYLDLASDHAQRKRIIKRMRDLELLAGSGDSASLQAAIRAFISETENKRQYNPVGNRFLKVFEFHNGFYYHKSQIETLGKLGVEVKGGSEADLLVSVVSGIYERPVGGGKTTVLLPTSGFKSADGKDLAMMIVTEAMIGNLSFEIERICGKTFGQRVRRFDFSRNTDLNPKNLKKILKSLKDVIEKKEYLMTTDRSLKAFSNQFIKLFYEYFTLGQKNLKEKVELMWQIRKLIKEKGRVLADESDLTLAPRHELNFPIGDPVPIPDSYLSLSLQLYEILYSQELRSIVSFDFLPGLPGSTPCTPKLYEEKVKPALADQFISLIEKPAKQGEDRILGVLRTFYEGLAETEKKWLGRYFLDDYKELVKTEKEWLRRHFLNDSKALTEQEKDGLRRCFLDDSNALTETEKEHLRRYATQQVEKWLLCLPSEEIRNLLGLVRGQLNILLPLTLQKNFGERYGFHTESSIVADPFSGANNPNLGSQFSDPFERIDYTIQAYLKQEMRRPVIEKLVYDLEGKKLDELKANLEAIKKLPPGTEYETAADRQFKRYFGDRKDLRLFDPKLIDRLMKIMKSSETAKFDLLKRYILPQIQVFEQNLKATSQSLVALFTPKEGRFKGFTGTLYNEKTYHDDLTGFTQDGARGKVVALAFAQAKDKVETIQPKIPSELHRELVIDHPKFQHIRALIDAGGALKEFDLERVASDWLDQLTLSGSSIQGVVFFDAKGRTMILEKGESNPIPLEKSECDPKKRITIYDQKHTTGTDILQAIDAVALVTVSKGMIMRDFIQAVGRMRQLASGQQIEIAILEDDAVFIRELLGLDKKAKLTIEDTIRFLILNEVKRQGEDNEVATNHKLMGRLQEWFLGKVLDAPSLEAIEKEHVDKGLVERLFFQHVSISPFLQYGISADLVDAKQVYRDRIAEILEKRLGLDQAIQRDPFLAKGEGGSSQRLAKTLMDAIDKAELPEKVRQSSFQTDREEQQEIQQEQQQEQEQQQQQEQQQEEQQEKGGRYFPWRHPFWFTLDPKTVEKAGFYESSDPSSKSNQNSPYRARFQKADEVITFNPKLTFRGSLFDDDFQVSYNYQLHGDAPLSGGGSQYFTFTLGPKVIPFGRFQKPLQNILIVQHPNTRRFKLIAIEPYEAAIFKEALQKKQGISPLHKDPDFATRYQSFQNLNLDYFSTQHTWDCLFEPGKNNRKTLAMNDWTCLSPTLSGLGKQVLKQEVKAIRLSSDVRVWIGDLNLNSLYEGSNPIQKNELENSPQLLRLLVQAKFFDGWVHYNEREQNMLKLWLRQRIGKKNALACLDQIEADFRTQYLAFKEESKRDYSKSALSRVFADLKKELS